MATIERSSRIKVKKEKKTRKPLEGCERETVVTCDDPLETAIQIPELDRVSEHSTGDQDVTTADSIAASTSNVSNTFSSMNECCEKPWDKNSSLEDEIQFEDAGVVQDTLESAVPSAPPCDISYDGDVVERIRSLEESSLCSLYPLTAFHVYLPSNAETRNHPLYVLLTDYLRSCDHLDRSLKKHASLVDKADRHREMVWSVTEEHVTESGKCKDEVPVVASYCRSIALKDEEHLSLLSRCLSAAREALHEECTLYLFDSEAHRLRVEHFVQEEEEAQAVVPSPEELRICVVILFSFVQRQDLNPTFASNVRLWLLRLGRAVLELGLPSDQLLLLSQLLRCPKGVSSWGAPLVKFDPPPPYVQSMANCCPKLELVMAGLSTLLDSPALLQFDGHHGKVASEETWVVLDSAGEEEFMDVPGDEDLEAFLDRIPLKAAAVQALGLAGEECLPSVSGVDVLRLFALSNSALKLLGNGLQRAGSRRYPRFCKRLAVLLHHLAHLVTDFWDLFTSSSHFECDPAMQARVAVEYDALLIRTSGYLFQSVNHSSGWEMLSMLPFKHLSLHARCHLLALFHGSREVSWIGDVTIPSKGWVTEIKESCPSFGTALVDESEQEASSLLITITNMAVSNGDSTFAEAVAYDIFWVGHLNPDTREKEFSRTANSLLASIFSKHPCLFSMLIDWLKGVSQEVEKRALALFSELPIHLWKPSEVDMSTLSTWILCHDPQTAKSTVARVILLAMPWRRGSEGHPLPLNVTFAAATLALEACLAWDTKGRISQLTSSTIWSESSISAWAWSLVGALCLHPLDRKSPHLQPNIDTSSRDSLLEAVPRGLQESHPLASLLAVLATDWGHNLTNAEKYAFSQLSIVVAHGKHVAAISALYLILPLFVDHHDELISCQTFQKLLFSLLFADRTYVKMAKNLISSEFPGPILSQFGNMLVSHLEQPCRFDTTASAFVSLWLNCILLVPNWMHEKEAIFVADLVIRSAVMDNSGRDWCEANVILGRLNEQYVPHSQSSPGTFSSLLSLLAREPSPGSPHPHSLVVRNSWPDFPWFVLAALDVEEGIEKKLWDHLQKELKATPLPGILTVDAALKNACQTLDLQPFPAAYLCVYRWARQAVDTPLGHPALPLIWARFFSIYSKVFSSSDGSCGVLFGGNSSRKAFLVQMKKRLDESAEWYSREVTEHGIRHDSSVWLRHCSRLFCAFGLWLDSGQYSYPPPSLPLQYAPDMLSKALLHENKRSWQKEFVDVAQAKSSIIYALQAWYTQRGYCSEGARDGNSNQLTTSPHPLQRMHARFKSCADLFPLPFPSHPSSSTRLEHVQIVCGRKVPSTAITTCLKPLLECARLYSLYHSEHTALDCALLELLPGLYKDVQVQFVCNVRCAPSASHDSNQTHHCSSPAKIPFKVKESQICEGVRAELETNLADRRRLIASVLSSAPHQACAAGILLENMVRELVLGKKNSMQGSLIQESSITILNLLLDLLSDEAVSHYLPAKKLLTSCLETLGQEFVEERQLLPLLSRALENPHLIGFVAPLLTPTAMSTNILLQAYGTLVKRLPNLDTNVAFVLLSKFEITHWLCQSQPISTERLELMKLVIEGLACCGANSNKNERMLVSGLLQRHLRALLIHNFPELFGEVLELLLRASGDHSLQSYLWYDVLDAVIRLGYVTNDSKPSLPLLNAEISSEQLSTLMKDFATGQKVISLKQVRDLATSLAAFFHHERLHFGLHGLYPKYRSHVKALRILFELLGHTLVAASNRGESEVPVSPGSTAALEYLWPALRDMFAPWLLPYWEDQLREEGALWILELMDGHPPLTPWIPSDGQHAEALALAFSHCMQFLLDIFPGHRNSLSLIWEMYSSSFAHARVGSHILGTMHNALLMLPWNKFWPSVQNLKDMVDVAETSPLECRLFLRTVLPCICWKEWTDSLASSILLSAEGLASFLRLLLLLSGNAYMSKVDYTGMLFLLVATKTFSWYNLSTSDYADSLDLFVASADPMVVLQWNSPDVEGKEDLAILELLRSIAGLHEPVQLGGLPPRCLPFLCTIVRLLATVIGGGQYRPSPVKDSTDAALVDLLQELQRVVVRGFPHKKDEEQIAEMAEVIKQVLLPILPTASPKFFEALSVALAPKPPQPSCSQPTFLCAKGLLCALHSTTLPHVQLGLLVESALETALVDRRGACSPMDEVPKLLHNEGDSKVAVADALSSAGHLLALTAYLRSSSVDIDLNASLTDHNDTLHLLVHRWLPAITITEDVEPKMPLIWARALQLAQKQQQQAAGRTSTAEALSILSSSLLTLGDGTEGMVSSLLGAVGLKRKSSPSKRFRVMCLTLAAFVLACLSGEEGHESSLKEAVAGVERLCRRHKELREVAALTTSAVCKPGLSLDSGTELLEMLLGRLYPEKPGYLQCIK